jgi:hypothetical protein
LKRKRTVSDFSPILLAALQRAEELGSLTIECKYGGRANALLVELRQLQRIRLKENPNRPLLTAQKNGRDVTILIAGSSFDEDVLAALNKSNKASTPESLDKEPKGGENAYLPSTTEEPTE